MRYVQFCFAHATTFAAVWFQLGTAVLTCCARILLLQNKHENYDKPDKHDKDYMPDGYMPDGYKPDGYKPDGYKPDGYKPDGYKPDGYKPDGYKPDGYKHKHPKYSKGEYKERYGNSG
jgi:hypothetical protein